MLARRASDPAKINPVRSTGGFGMGSSVVIPNYLHNDGAHLAHFQGVRNEHPVWYVSDEQRGKWAKWAPPEGEAHILAISASLLLDVPMGTPSSSFLDIDKILASHCKGNSESQH